MHFNKIIIGLNPFIGRGLQLYDRRKQRLRKTTYRHASDLNAIHFYYFNSSIVKRNISCVSSLFPLSGHFPPLFVQYIAV